MRKFSTLCTLAISLIAQLGAAEGPSTAGAETSALVPVDVAARSVAASTSMHTIDLKKVFGSAPVIYTLLIILSIVALMIWIHTLTSWKEQSIIPEEFLTKVSDRISEGDFDQAKSLCDVDNSAISSIIESGLAMRHQGSGAVFKAIEAEGKRLGLEIWQRVSLLNDIAVTAPMLGLLGTVVGIFYGLYDKQRSPESLITVFDGLGVAIGTTVVGLMVAILAMLLHASLKIWATRLLSKMESRVLKLAAAMTKAKDQ